jgi:coenzyme F420-0:L-glutamate ligase/coenzyme F420-1:gamma-L-glutamate ligase
MIEIHGITGMAEVRAGDDLARLIAAALAALTLYPIPGDVLVVTQKIVSKAEGRLVSLHGVTPGAEARRLAGITGKDARLVELVLAESRAVVRAAPAVLITRHRSGLVMANAGIDRSNIGAGGEELVLLLPLDADASAARLRGELQGLGAAIDAVVIADSFGRPWRKGVVNVAIGAAGLAALDDRRGAPDRDGRRLEVTQIAIADLVASAAGLAMGEGAEGVPAVLLRGFRAPAGEAPAAALIRSVAEDLFR